MPYIKKNERATQHVAMNPKTVGDLEYDIHILMEDYLRNNGKCFKTMLELVGALECCKLELYRRMVGPYEDTKIEANGDIRLYEPV